MSVVKYTGPETFPRREDFIDKELDATIVRDITVNKPIFFMPNDVFEQTTNIGLGKEYNYTYTPILIGAIESGRRVSIVVTNERPFFDIEMVKNQPEYESIMDQNGLQFDTTEVVYQKPFFYYTKNTRPYLRVYFKKASDRKKSINYFNSAGISTYWDDLTSYYRKVAREKHLNLADWLLLKKYKVVQSKDIKGVVLFVNIADIASYTGKPITLETEGHEEYVDSLSPLEPQKDKLMSLAYDIENYSTHIEVSPKNMDDQLFMIGCGFAWYYEVKPFTRICLTTLRDIDPLEDTLTVQFDDYRSMLIGFGDLLARMCPDYWFGYNNSQYDDPYLHARYVAFGLEKQFIEKICPVKINQYNSNNIKFVEDKEIKIEANKKQKCSVSYWPLS
jgi:DNA polymerase elongation subunit (family B)